MQYPSTIAKQPIARSDDELIERYGSLVSRVSRRYFAPGMEREDVVQEGMIGLLAAFRSYKGDPRVPFEPFASLCVVRRIQTAVTRARSVRHAPLNAALPLSRAGLVTSPPSGFALPSDLSPLENDVLRLIQEGASRVNVAAQLGRDLKSVDNALQRARQKMRDAWVSCG